RPIVVQRDTGGIWMADGPEARNPSPRARTSSPPDAWRQWMGTTVPPDRLARLYERRFPAPATTTRDAPQTGGASPARRSQTATSDVHRACAPPDRRARETPRRRRQPAALHHAAR